MSRLSKYLNQTAKWQKVIKDDTGNPQMDEYSNLAYSDEMTIKCRREPARINYTSSYGQFISYRDVYYVDETVDIAEKDLLDGRSVLAVYPYIDGSGTLIGYEVNV